MAGVGKTPRTGDLGTAAGEPETAGIPGELEEERFLFTLKETDSYYLMRLSILQLSTMKQYTFIVIKSNYQMLH